MGAIQNSVNQVLGTAAAGAVATNQALNPMVEDTNKTIADKTKSIQGGLNDLKEGAEVDFNAALGELRRSTDEADAAAQNIVDYRRNATTPEERNMQTPEAKNLKEMHQNSISAMNDAYRSVDAARIALDNTDQLVRWKAAQWDSYTSKIEGLNNRGIFGKLQAYEKVNSKEFANKRPDMEAQILAGKLQKPIKETK